MQQAVVAACTADRHNKQPHKLSRVWSFLKFKSTCRRVGGITCLPSPNHLYTAGLDLWILLINFPILCQNTWGGGRLHCHYTDCPYQPRSGFSCVQFNPSMLIPSIDPFSFYHPIICTTESNFTHFFVYTLANNQRLTIFETALVAYCSLKERVT